MNKITHGKQQILKIDIEKDLEYNKFAGNEKDWLSLISVDEFLGKK